MGMKKNSVLLGFLIGSIFILIFFGISVLMLSVLPESSAKSLLSGGSIGVIEINSVITESQPMLEQIKKYREDKSIKAILVRIDSPGGGVGPAQEIYSELLKTRTAKPIVASLGGTAASGGYYIACAANTIVANPGTLTGSIGAIMEFMNVQGLYQWAGVSNEVIKSGQHKDMGSWARNLTNDEKKLLQGVVDDVLTQFVQAISDGRKIPADEIVPLADGRIFTGEQALNLGLVDKIGNFNDAVDTAAEMGHITGKPTLVRMKEKKLDMLDLFLDNVGGRFQGRLEQFLQKHGSTGFLKLNYR